LRPHQSNDNVLKAVVQSDSAGICRLVGVVEAWVWETPWEEVQASTSLDDGDTARLFSRIADMLRQIRDADSVDSALRATAASAHDRVYRNPVCDLLGL
jgi:superfamily II RNA helicase